MEKKALRLEMKKRRKEIPEELRLEKSRIVCQKLLEHPACRGDLRGRNIMSFYSFSGEIETRELIAALLSRGANLYLPRVRSVRERSMDIVRFEGESAMLRSAYGILEPAGNDIILPERLDLIIVPALAFDFENRRLGYGGGFYDGILAAAREDCLKLGIAFEEQIIEELPTEAHDLPVDLVIYA